MTENQTFDSILEKAAISRDVYMNALKVSHHGRSVILKSDPCDVNINGCNDKILCLWGANIDFQFVLDEYSMVMYICSYMMTKVEHIKLPWVQVLILNVSTL